MKMMQMKRCQILLDEPDIETAVGVGDVHGIIVKHQENNGVTLANVSPDFGLRVCNIQLSASFLP